MWQCIIMQLGINTEWRHCLISVFLTSGYLTQLSCVSCNSCVITLDHWSPWKILPNLKIKKKPRLLKQTPQPRPHLHVIHAIYGKFATSRDAPAESTEMWNVFHPHLVPGKLFAQAQDTWSSSRLRNRKCLLARRRWWGTDGAAVPSAS